MNQLLVGIRVLKMYAWEAAQEASVLAVRKNELGELRNAIPLRVGMQVRCKERVCWSGAVEQWIHACSIMRVCKTLYLHAPFPACPSAG